MGYILGLGGPFTHDASACLVDDEGNVVAFIEEERFSRRKHHMGSRSCTRSAAYCLATAGITLNDLDEIAVAFNPYWPTPTGEITDIDLIREILDPDLLGGVTASRLTCVPHHLAHAASAFYPSGFADSAVIVVDGTGDGVSTSLFRGTTAGLEVLQDYPFSQSLGWFYETVAEHLGLGDWTSAGKLMGLAAYGRPVYDLDFLSADDGDSYLLDLSRWGLPPNQDYIGKGADGRVVNGGAKIWEYNRKVKRIYERVYTELGIPAHHRAARYDPSTGRMSVDTTFRQAHADLAASAQQVLERQLLTLARTVMRESRSSRLCIAGGVGLNCSANGVLHRNAGLTDLFIQPAAGDAGCALGAALECVRRAGRLPLPRPRQVTTAWGPEFSDAQIATTLRDMQIKYTDHGDYIARVAAQHIARGKVVGWFQGPAEAGPRALGNRSILADPRHTATRDQINRDIKRREDWRPFAPSIHADVVAAFIEQPGPAEFMIVAHRATDKALTTIPATVHVDGTIRAQAVRAESNPRYADLLLHMDAEAGVPAVLNTSFNHESEPIVCNPVDALRTFYSTPMDALAIGGFLITKDGQ